MQSSAGWLEPGQTREFDEYALVLGGSVRITHRAGLVDVGPGQIVLAHAGVGSVQHSWEGRRRVRLRLPADLLPRSGPSP